MQISVEYYIYLSIILLFIGIMGFFSYRKSIISMMLSIEIMLLACNINFVAFSYMWSNLLGQIMTLMVIICAAAEFIVVAILIVLLYKNNSSILYSDIENIGENQGS